MPILNFDFPGVTLRQVFEGTTTATRGTLDVVCIGPRYEIYKMISDTSKFTVKFQYDNTDSSLAYPVTLTSANGTLDSTASTQRVYLTDAQCAYAELAVSTASGKTATFASSVITSSAFSGRGARVGDAVRWSITDDGTTTVTDAVITKISTDGLQVTFSKTAPAADTVVKFCYQAAELKCPAGYSMAKSADSNVVTVTMSGSITISTNFGSGTATVIKATAYPEFRIITGDEGTIGYITTSTDIEDQLGPAGKDNPLALACLNAYTAGGRIVTFITVASDTSDAYGRAIDLVAERTDLYSIVPCSSNPDVIVRCNAECTSANEDADSKVRRALWYGVNNPEYIVLDNEVTGTSSTVEGKVVVTVTSANPYLDIAWKAGDALKHVAGDVVTLYLIESVNGSSLTLAASSTTPPQASTTYSLVRTKPSAAEMVPDILANVVTGSEHAVGVWADDYMYDGEIVENYACAAAAAGMRAGEEPHRPLSNLTYSNLQVAGTHKFTKSDLKQLGANGVWIIANNQNGIPINMRQVTTAASNNINKDEESIVANADSIAIGLSRIGESMTGNSNINDTMLMLLEHDLRVYMDEFLNDKSGSLYVGPQLIAWELVYFGQNAVARDHVDASLTCTPPPPFNKFNITMRII